MAEHDVSYASVVFKANKHPPPQASANKEEETVYDEVKVQNEAAAQTPNLNAGILPDQKPNSGRQRLACCLGILCVILLLGIIAVSVFFVLSHESDVKELQDENTALKKLSGILRSDIETMRRNLSNLDKQLGDLKLNYTDLKSEATNLTRQNQQLQEQRSNLTEQIANMETNWINGNVSRAQWSVEAYCPKAGGERQCLACQPGWLLNKSSCYAYNNPGILGEKTWEEARKDCRGKGSDLAVARNQQEKDAIQFYSPDSYQFQGYWIGLRVEDEEWKWIDGRELKEDSRLGKPTKGRCAMSVRNQGWKSWSCDDKQRWICKKNALSV